MLFPGLWFMHKTDNVKKLLILLFQLFKYSNHEECFSSALCFIAFCNIVNDFRPTVVRFLPFP